MEKKWKKKIVESCFGLEISKTLGEELIFTIIVISIKFLETIIISDFLQESTKLSFSNFINLNNLKKNIYSH